VEKSKTLNAATGVHRAAQDCTKYANVILTRLKGESPFILHLPESPDPSTMAPPVRKTSLGPLQEYETADETLVGESAPETISEPEAESANESEYQQVQEKSEVEGQQEGDVSMDPDRSLEQDDTVKAEQQKQQHHTRGSSLTVSIPMSVDNSPQPPTSEDLEYGGNDDSIVSFPSEEESATVGEEEDEEEVESVTLGRAYIGWRQSACYFLGREDPLWQSTLCSTIGFFSFIHLPLLDRIHRRWAGTDSRSRIG